MVRVINHVNLTVKDVLFNAYPELVNHYVKLDQSKNIL